MIFDTHAHYDDAQFDDDREHILASMEAAGIGGIVNASSDTASWEKIVSLTETYSFLYGAIGVHPDEVGQLNEDKFSYMEKLLQRDKMVAVGEIEWTTIGIRRAVSSRNIGLSVSLSLPKDCKSRSSYTAVKRQQIRWRS